LNPHVHNRTLAPQAKLTYHNIRFFEWICCSIPKGSSHCGSQIVVIGHHSLDLLAPLLAPGRRGRGAFASLGVAGSCRAGPAPPSQSDRWNFGNRWTQHPGQGLNDRPRPRGYRQGARLFPRQGARTLRTLRTLARGEATPLGQLRTVPGIGNDLLASKGPPGSMRSSYMVTICRVPWRGGLCQ
jgi:hypothetical protein